MAIAQRGTAVTSTDNSLVTSTLSPPAGLAEGDLEFIAVADDNAAGNLLSASGTGWATLASSPITSGQHYSTLFWRIVPAGESASDVTVTFENTAARALGRFAFYWDDAGLDTWEKIDEDAAHTAGAATSLAAPTIDIEENQLLILIATNDTSNSVNSDPTSMTGLFNIEGASAACAAFYDISSATGSSGAGTVGWEGGADEGTIIIASFRASVTTPSGVPVVYFAQMRARRNNG